ncbi:hypothetical protein [Amycolatopsis sp.]|uniref:hypothetical protein n=1 Tax=Amycolatopsis sp. TaxID=37632 RepID=UPI00260D13EA|nr:hypothetical protein [Amycolatopsis sp.]
MDTGPRDLVLARRERIPGAGRRDGLGQVGVRVRQQARHVQPARFGRRRAGQ